MISFSAVNDEAEAASDCFTVSCRSSWWGAWRFSSSVSRSSSMFLRTECKFLRVVSMFRAGSTACPPDVKTYVKQAKCLTI